MEDINFIPILNLSISAFTGIVVTIYLWKRNTTITKKEKLIKIYFDLASSLSNYGTYYKNRLSYKIKESIINYIERIPSQYGNYEHIELYKKLALDLKKEYKIDDEPKEPNKYNPNYYLRLLIVNLSRKENKKLAQTLDYIKEDIKKFAYLECYYTDYEEITKIINVNIIKDKFFFYESKMITFDELKLQLMDELYKVYDNLYVQHKPNDRILETDEDIIEFIIRM